MVGFVAKALLIFSTDSSILFVITNNTCICQASIGIININFSIEQLYFLIYQRHNVHALSMNSNFVNNKTELHLQISLCS